MIRQVFRTSESRRGEGSLRDRTFEKSIKQEGKCDQSDLVAFGDERQWDMEHMKVQRVMELSIQISTGARVRARVCTWEGTRGSSQPAYCMDECASDW